MPKQRVLLAGLLLLLASVCLLLGIVLSPDDVAPTSGPSGRGSAAEKLPEEHLL